MTMNGNDVNREKAKSAAQTGNEVQRLRESCVTLLDLLESPEAVQRVLLCVSRLYNDQERRKARKEYPGGVLKTTTPQNGVEGARGSFAAAWPLPHAHKPDRRTLHDLFDAGSLMW